MYSFGSPVSTGEGQTMWPQDVTIRCLTDCTLTDKHGMNLATMLLDAVQYRSPHISIVSV